VAESGEMSVVPKPTTSLEFVDLRYLILFLGILIFEYFYEFFFFLGASGLELSLFGLLKFLLEFLNLLSQVAF
jgi:hypothetical protein